MSTPRPLAFEIEPGRFLRGDMWGPERGVPVLFLHGGGQTRHSWARAAASVAERGWRALTIDHRGHGDSDWHPDGIYGFADFAADLEALLALLDDRPVLVGASLGGVVSLVVETRDPARNVCRGLVLVDITPRTQPEGVARILEFMRARPDGFATLDEAADHVAAYLGHRERRRDTDGLLKNLRRRPDGRWRWHWDPRLLDSMGSDPERASQAIEEHLSRASTLTVPTLLVRGRMSDVVSEEDARSFLTAVPHAEYVDVAGAAHTVAGDRNDAFTAAVLDFLDRRIATGGQP